MLITDTDIFNKDNQHITIEADGFYNEYGMITEDNKKKKKTKTLIKS